MTSEQFLSATYVELYEATDITPPEWSRWFNEVSYPKLDTLMKIADYLEMPIGTLTEAFVARIVKPKNF